MGWDKKARGRAGGYFYRSVRVPGRPHPVKVYVGAGPYATAASLNDEASRAEKAEAAAEVSRWGGLDRLLGAMADAGRVAAAGALRAAGYHYHRGEWRRPMAGRAVYDENWFRKITQRAAADARRGDRDAADRAEQLIRAHPYVVDGVAGIAERAAEAWVAAAGAGDPLAAEAVRRELAALRGGLATDPGGTLVAALTEQLAVALLAVQVAARAAAEPRLDDRVAAARVRAAEAAQRRVLTCVRTLSLVREKLPEGTGSAPAVRSTDDSAR